MSENYFIGIDIGGTTIKTGLGNGTEKLIHGEIFTNEGKHDTKLLMNQLKSILKYYKNMAAEKKLHLAAAGVGTPGKVDPSTGVIRGFSVNLAGFTQVELGPELIKEAELPVVVDNDAVMAAYAEFFIGTARQFQQGVMLTFGTGVGGAIFQQNSFYRGHDKLAGELGHLTIHFNGRACNCGLKGCWERYSSASGLILNYQELKGNDVPISPKDILTLSGTDDIARKARQLTIDYTAQGLISLQNIFNPQVFVLGGGLLDIYENYFTDIVTAYNQRVNDLHNPPFSTLIIRAQFRNWAGVLGSIQAARNSLKVYE